MDRLLPLVSAATSQRYWYCTLGCLTGPLSKHIRVLNDIRESQTGRGTAAHVPNNPWPEPDMPLYLQANDLHQKNKITVTLIC